MQRPWTRQQFLIGLNLELQKEYKIHTYYVVPHRLWIGHCICRKVVWLWWGSPPLERQRPPRLGWARPWRRMYWGQTISSPGPGCHCRERCRTCTVVQNAVNAQVRLSPGPGLDSLRPCSGLGPWPSQPPKFPPWPPWPPWRHADCFINSSVTKRQS